MSIVDLLTHLKHEASSISEIFSVTKLTPAYYLAYHIQVSPHGRGNRRGNKRGRVEGRGDSVPRFQNLDTPMQDCSIILCCDSPVSNNHLTNRQAFIVGTDKP